jgi:hypothetical protein
MLKNENKRLQNIKKVQSGDQPVKFFNNKKYSWHIENLAKKKADNT